MRYRIFGRDEASGLPVEPFILEAEDEQDARNLARESRTKADRIEIALAPNANHLSEKLPQSAPGLIARVVGGFVIGAIVGAIPGVFVGCLVAPQTELGYGPIVFLACIVIGAFVGAGVGSIIAVVRSIEQYSDEIKQSEKDREDKLRT